MKAETHKAEEKRYKIVHLTSLHRAFDPRIFFREAMSAQKSGYEVVIIASGGERQKFSGIEVLVFPEFSSRFLRFLLAPWIMLVMALQQRADIYQFHDPELMPMGVMLRFLRKRVVYDVHEDLPRDVYNKKWLPGFLRPFLSRGLELGENVVGKVVSGVVAATPIIARRFPEAKTVCVRNFPSPESYVEPPRALSDVRHAKAVYVGGLSAPRGLNIMLEAGEKIASQRPYSLLLAGQFRPPSLEQDVKSFPFVDCRGMVPAPEVPNVLARAQVGLVLLQPLQSYIDAMPLKLFEYMAAGLPVVASDFGVMREVIGQYNCGLFVPPDDAEALAAAQLWLFEHAEEAAAMGRRGRQAVLSGFNWASQAQELNKLYRHMLS